MSLVVVGTVAFDKISTPFGSSDKIVWGAATFIGLSASQFYKDIALVSVIGDDFPTDFLDGLRKRNINLDGLQIKEGEKSSLFGNIPVCVGTVKIIKKYPQEDRQTIHLSGLPEYVALGENSYVLIAGFHRNFKVEQICQFYVTPEEHITLISPLTLAVSRELNLKIKQIAHGRIHEPKSIWIPWATAVGFPPTSARGGCYNSHGFSIKGKIDSKTQRRWQCEVRISSLFEHVKHWDVITKDSAYHPLSPIIGINFRNLSNLQGLVNVSSVKLTSDFHRLGFSSMINSAWQLHQNPYNAYY